MQNLSQFKKQFAAQQARIAELERALTTLVREQDAGRTPLARDWAIARAALKVSQ